MYELIWWSWLLEIFVVNMTPWRRKHASKVHVSIPLKLVQGFKNELSMLCAYPCESLQEVVVEVSIAEKLRKFPHVLWRIWIFEALWLSWFGLRNVHLDEAKGLICVIGILTGTTTLLLVQGKTSPSESLTSSFSTSSLRISFDANEIQSVNK